MIPPNPYMPDLGPAGQDALKLNIHQAGTRTVEINPDDIHRNPGSRMAASEESTSRGAPEHQ